MSNKASESAESILKKLRRLDANMICPNCGTPGQRGIGFGNVCVKFSTFICDLCKTSHQAISHQVKSITMSNWTMEEVNKLMDQRGGGNAAAQHIWLANAPAFGGKYAGGQRPKQGDRVEIFKQFVLDAYEYGKFRANTPYTPQSTAAASAPVAAPVAAPAARPTPSLVPPSAVPVVSSTAPFSADFDFFNSTDAASGSASPLPPHQGHSSSTNTSRSTSQSVSAPLQKQTFPTANGLQDPFFVSDFAQFDAFSAASTPTPVTSAPAAPSQSRAVSSSASMPPRPPVTTAGFAAVSAASTTKSSTASLIDLLDEPVVSGQVSPVPQSLPQSHQPSHPTAASVFDPFGTSTGTASVSSTNVGSSNQTNNVLDLFHGLSFDAPASGSNSSSNNNSAPMMMSAQSQPVMLRSPPIMMPMMSQSPTPPMMMMGGGGMGNGMGMHNMNYMAAPNAMRPPGMMMATNTYGTNSGNRSPVTPSMLPMNAAGAGNVGRGSYPYSNNSNNYNNNTNNNNNNNSNSFDFLQDTMRKHLDSAASNNNASSNGAPINPFR